MAANLFQSLFSYRPGDVLTPAENFLTEGFAYLLKSHDEVAQAWAEKVLLKHGCTIDFDMCSVETQEPFRRNEGATTVFPDMVIRCSLEGRETHVILSEHKWSSSTNREQLRTYRSLLVDFEEGSCVAFIGARVDQQAEALQECKAAFLWEDVYRFLVPYAKDSGIVREFVEFLRSQGLGPQEPLSLGMIAAYTYARPIPDRCMDICKRLGQSERIWDFLPERFRTQRQAQGLRWGRVVLEFGPGNWHLMWHVAAGFLLDGTDHQLELCAPERGFDLMFLIEGQRTTKIKGSVLLEKANSLRAKFPDAQVTDQNQAKSPWRKLVVRRPLADVIAPHDTEEAQTEAIYQQFEAWCVEIFADGMLEAAFWEMWPSSGD